MSVIGAPRMPPTDELDTGGWKAVAGESRGLGRGLSALLGDRPALAAAPPPASLSLAIRAIRPGMAQPRRTIHCQPLEELAASIKEKGVIQPILVRPIAPMGEVCYELVAGHRRWHASQLAGLTTIPAVVRELSDADAVAVALIENIQREELTPAEEARALKRLSEEFNLTHQEVAQAVGRSRAAVTNLMRLLDLPEAILQLVDSRALSMGHARALLGLQDDAARLRIGGLVASRDLSVRETERLVRKAGREGTDPPAPVRGELSIVSELLRTAAMRAEVHSRPSGSGRLIIDFADAGAGEALIAAVRAVAEACASVEHRVEQSSSQVTDLN
jgi:ParB family transcriptional regulator, chromosome partitioning protein